MHYVSQLIRLYIVLLTQVGVKFRPLKAKFETKNEFQVIQTASPSHHLEYDSNLDRLQEGRLAFF